MSKSEQKLGFDTAISIVETIANTYTFVPLERVEPQCEFNGIKLVLHRLLESRKNLYPDNNRPQYSIKNPQLNLFEDKE